MKYIKILILIFISNAIFGQGKSCHTDILNGIEIDTTNQLKRYLKNDFSVLWTHENNTHVYGIIGNDNQRILIKFLTIEKNIVNPSEYLVYGKTKVKENVCEFVGKITIINCQEFRGHNFGVDNEYQYSGIKSQGLITAKYEFFENKSQNHVGYFSGILKSKFYIDKNDHVKYNDIEHFSDGYFNNSFVGVWKNYNSNQEKRCHWADYRVPNCDCDFDIGVGEFNVSEKYFKNGWLDIALAGRAISLDIQESKPKTIEKIKNWWE